MSYVIIGNSAAAIGAVEGIRKFDSKQPITIISDEPYHTYSRPLISYFLAGNRNEKQMYYRSEDFYIKNKVEVKLGSKAVDINSVEKYVLLEDGEKVCYKNLLIATGGKPFVPPIKGLEDCNKDIYSFIKLEDAKTLKKVAKPGIEIVIVGAGLIGLKAAEALAKIGVKVTVADLASRVLSSILDEGSAKIVQKSLEQKGIRFHLGTTAQQIINGEEHKTVVLADGTKLKADGIVLAVGVVPNTDLAKQAEVDINRGVITDERMETSVKGIFAAGDVAENYDLLLKQKRVIPILPNAYQQGYTAGANMAGADATYLGGFAKNAISFFGLPMVTAGVLHDDDAKEYVSKQGDNYIRILLKEAKIIGFIRVNAVDRSGILTGLMMEQTDVTHYIDDLLKDEPALVLLPGEQRQSRLQGGAVQWL